MTMGPDAQTDARRPAGARRPGAAATLGLALALLAGCRSVPIEPVPPPLPEALDWALAGRSGAYLGLKVEENDSGRLDDLFFEPGVRVVRVVENSPAHAAGIQVGDVVLSAGGAEVDDPGALDAVVQAAAAGDPLALQVQRGDTVFDVDLRLAAAGGDVAPPEPAYRLDPSRSRAGWATAPDGVVLVASRDDGPFPRAGLPLGTRVRTVDGTPVRSDRALIRLLQTRPPGATVTVEAVLPDERRVQRPVTLFAAPTRLTGFSVPVLVSWQQSVDGTSCSLSLLDLWVFQLFRWEREGREQHWTFLELFGFDLFTTATGVGELDR